MPLVLRKIRRTRWYTQADDADALYWLPQGEFQSDTFLDVQTRSNALSVFEIPDDKSTLSAVVAALAANCDAVSNLDYVLIPRQELETLGVEMEELRGETRDAAVNDSHRNATRLTARILQELVKLIGSHSTDIGRFSEREVTIAIHESVRQGRMKVEDFKADFRASYEKRLRKFNLS